MATKSKKLLANAREDKARRARLELDRLTNAQNEATSDEERTQAAAALNAYYEEQAQDEERKGQLKDAQNAARQAKRDAGINVRKRRVQWAEGGRDLVPGLSKRGKEYWMRGRRSKSFTA